MEENGNGHENMLSSSLSNSLISVERYADLRNIFFSSSNSIFISIILLMYLVIQLLTQYWTDGQGLVLEMLSDQKPALQEIFF